MNPCPHCGRMTNGTVDGSVVHATCERCTAALLKGKEPAIEKPVIKRKPSTRVKKEVHK